jgi:hypothetical protein
MNRHRWSWWERVLVGLAVVSLLSMSFVLVALVMTVLSHSVQLGNK